MCSTAIIVIIKTEKDVFPFLPELMTHLLSLLDNADTSEISMKLKEFSFSCIASIGEMFLLFVIRLVSNLQSSCIWVIMYFLTIQIQIQFVKLSPTMLELILNNDENVK